MQPWEQIIDHEIPRKQMEVVGGDMFTLHNKMYLCLVDYHSKFSVIKKMKDFSPESLIVTYKIIFRVWITKQNDVILLEETSFHQFSNMASSGLKKMFSQQFFYTQNVCGKIFSYTILIIYVWLVVLA